MIHASFSIGRSIFTSGVLSPPLLLSSRAFSLEVHRSLPRVGGSLLQDSGLQEFQPPRSLFHLECFILELTDTCHVSSPDQRSSFTSELQLYRHTAPELLSAKVRGSH
jgi:hypothetical protein